jgi:predicted Zn-dependent protease with MMP-like domain
MAIVSSFVYCFIVNAKKIGPFVPWPAERSPGERFAPCGTAANACHARGNMTRRPRLSPRAFDRVIQQAIARIPAGIRSHLDNVLITVQPYPSAELLEELGFAPDEELFGVFLGVPLPERSLSEPPLYPDTIYIFQEPLEEFCQSREELIDEIEITIVHEIAHFVGFDDDQLESFGYG